MATKMYLDTHITSESIERNFQKLNSYIKTTDAIIVEQGVLLTAEQKARIKAMNAAVEQANKFIEERITAINSYVEQLITAQQELANVIDTEVRETIASVETSLNDAINTVVTVDIPSIRNTIDSAVAALDEAKVSHVEFNNQVNVLAQADTDSRSLITQNASSISSIVGTLTKEPNDPSQYHAISVVKQQADTLQTTVTSNKVTTDGQYTTLSSQNTQRAGEISAIVINLNTDPFTNTTQPYNSFTKIKQTTDTIQYTVSANKAAADGSINTLNSQMTAVPGQITAAVTETKTDITNNQITPLTTRVSAIEVDTGGIHTTVVANKADADGKISTQATRIDQLPGQINLAVAQAPSVSAIPNLANLRLSVEGLSSTVSNHTGSISALTQRASDVEITVANNALSTASSFQVTNSSISAIVTDLGKDPSVSPYASITALKGLIDLSVKDADLTGANVVTRINLSPAGTRIDGKLLYVTSDTVFASNVTIQGNLIVGKSITSAQIGLGALNDNTILVKGTIEHGQTIPLPDGYTESQCVWGVIGPVHGSVTGTNPYTGETVYETPNRFSSDTNRLVYSAVYFAYSFYVGGDVGATQFVTGETVGGSVYYWIMGVK